MTGPSPELRDLLRKTFGVKKPKELVKPAPLPIHDLPKEKTRGIGDVMLSAEAQRIYNANMPPTPAQPIRQPSAKQQGTGTGSAMSLNEPWGGPPGKE